MASAMFLSLTLLSAMCAGGAIWALQDAKATAAWLAGASVFLAMLAILMAFAVVLEKASKVLEVVQAQD